MKTPINILFIFSLLTTCTHDSLGEDIQQQLPTSRAPTFEELRQKWPTTKQDEPRTGIGKHTLTGLKGIHPPSVVVLPGSVEDSMERAIKRAGGASSDEVDRLCLWLRTELRSHIVSLLESSGIRLLSSEEPRYTLDEIKKGVLKQQPNIPSLWVYVNLRKVHKDVPLYTFFVTTFVEEAVQLRRNLSIHTHVATWVAELRPPTIYVASSERIEQAIKSVVTEQLNTFCQDFFAANPKEKSTKKEHEKQPDLLDRIAEEALWVKCNNPDCGAAYQIGKEDYYQQIEERVKANPMALQTPPLTCKVCARESLYRAVKCEKCGHMFFYGNPNDFNDRCPECGYSKVENERKKRTPGLSSTPSP